MNQLGIPRSRWEDNIRMDVKVRNGFMWLRVGYKQAYVRILQMRDFLDQLNNYQLS